MSKSKTPRTDEFLERLSAIPYDGKDYDRLEAFSRQLETELNEANAKLAELERQIADGELIAAEFWEFYESLSGGVSDRFRATPYQKRMALYKVFGIEVTE
jgi:phage terminase Nu1 subunit (DNA packaging protein)